jgi:uncharacterized protein
VARTIGICELPGAYAVCRLEPRAPLPAWADGEGFVSISRTTDELSVVCLASRAPADIRKDGPWTAFKFVGPFDFAETGIATAVLNPLAAAGIGVFLVSTFDTDYLLVKRSDRDRAISALRLAEHRLSLCEPIP